MSAVLQPIAAELDTMHRLFKLQQEDFLNDMNPSYEVRIDRLNRLGRMNAKYQDRIAEAISADFGNRARQESTFGETVIIETGLKHTRHHLRKWMKTQRMPTALQFKPGYSRLIRQPLGVVGIISPWNYPYQLAIMPAIGAIAAGNRVLIKPSELTPRTGELIREMVAEFFKEDEIAVVTGDAEVGKAFTQLPFDHLVFTGSTAVGRIVAQAAAKNLTPVTLELGGKSPAIVDTSDDLTRTVERLAFGKLFNAGQTCIAPDYVFVPRTRVDAFVEALRRQVATFYPTLANNADYTSIVNDRHYSRLNGLLEDARAKGAQVVELNPAKEKLPAEQRKIAPTVVLGANDQMRIMQEEIFGPLLPIMPYDRLEEVVRYINRHDRPLALYWFGDDSGNRDYILNNTISGGVTVNDCLLHIAQEDMPFGGVGPSGLGAYHGEYGFRAFSKEKPVFFQSKLAAMKLLYPPYGKRFDQIIGLVRRMP